MLNRRGMFTGAALCVLCASLLLVSAYNAPDGSSRPQLVLRSQKTEMAKVISLKKGIRLYRNSTWRWQDAMLSGRSPTAYHERWAKGVRYLRWTLRQWLKRNKLAREKAQNPPHLKGWLCIHRYEGAWNDPNAPYYGGLQMDLSFQRAYGGKFLDSKGTADHWSPLEQMWVAERAFSAGRGYYPWPNTARFCNLI